MERRRGVVVRQGEPVGLANRPEVRRLLDKIEAMLRHRFQAEVNP